MLTVSPYGPKPIESEEIVAVQILVENSITCEHILHLIAFELIFHSSWDSEKEYRVNKGSAENIKDVTIPTNPAVYP